MKPFIPTAFYGVLNYILAVVLIASPWLFDYASHFDNGNGHISSAALLIPIYMGWLQLIMAIFVDNETGFVKQFPMQMHLVIDVVMGFILAVSPWLWSFASPKGSSSGVFLHQLLLGLLLFCLGLFTKKSPFTTKAHQSAPEGIYTSTDSTEGRLSI
ncbi:MAG TPA: SPW repeat protein [Mucilaginibacter sp.]